MDPQAKEQLIKIAKPKAGDDFFKLWQKANEVIDAINDISISIVPKDYITKAVSIEDGNIQLNFNADKINAALRALQQSSNPTSGNTDNPGGPTSGDDDTTGHGNPGCTAAAYTAFGALCGSIVVLTNHRCFDTPILCVGQDDVCHVYDNRVNNNLIGTMQSNLFASYTSGIIESHFGVVFGLTLDWIVTSSGGSCLGCAGVFTPVVFSAFQEDYDSTTGYKKPVALPP